jgi:predicted metal-dependent hydrolase
LEYVIVHEIAHILEQNHSERFMAILDEHYPTWREVRDELNNLPLLAEAWRRHQRRPRQSHELPASGGGIF